MTYLRSTGIDQRDPVFVCASHRPCHRIVHCILDAPIATMADEQSGERVRKRDIAAKYM